MASTKKSSTSKTARVMNLLSKSREDMPVEQPVAPTPAPEASAPPVQAAPATEAVVSPAPAPAPAPAAHTQHTTPLISSMQTDSAISNQVLSALENALEDELKPEQPEPPAAPVEAAQPVEEVSEPVSEAVHEVPAQQEALPEVEAPAEEPAVEPAPAAAPEVVAEIPAEEPTTAPEAAANEPIPAEPVVEMDQEPAPPTQFKVDAHTTYVNVMETLVEEKANKYIDMFGLCKCHRCIADVKAYALNHLTPKYVVMRTGEVIPRITLYENQFSAVVTAQILNACKIVMASPRHDLP